MSDKGRKKFIDTFVKKHKPAPEHTSPRKRIVLETYVETLKRECKEFRVNG
ncbi:hypothetical protein V6C27_14390 [Peptococcaceae bacterium 1198_IL3148]